MIHEGISHPSRGQRFRSTLFPAFWALFAALLGLAIVLGGQFAIIAALCAAIPALLIALHSDRSLLALFFIAALLPMPPGTPLSINTLSVTIYLTDFLLVAALAACSLRLAAFRPLPRPAAIYGAVMVCAAVLGATHPASFDRLATEVRSVAYLITAFILGYGLRRRQDQRLALYVAVIILWYSAATVLASALLNITLVTGRVEPISYGAVETRFLIPSTTLSLLVLAVCLCLPIALPKLPNMRLVILAATPAFIVVFLSFSRNSLAAIAVALFTTVSFARYRKRLLILIPALSLAGAVMVALLQSVGGSGDFIARQLDAYSDRVFEGLSQSAVASDPGITFRRLENRYAMSSFLQRPVLGSGLGTYYRPYLPIEPFTDPTTGPAYVHNLFLWYLAKSGVIGLLSFLILVLTPLWRTCWVAHGSGVPSDGAQLAVASAVLGIIVVNFVAPLLYAPGDAALIGLLIGHLYAFSMSADEPHNSNPSEHPLDHWQRN